MSCPHWNLMVRVIATLMKTISGPVMESRNRFLLARGRAPTWNCSMSSVVVKEADALFSPAGRSTTERAFFSPNPMLWPRLVAQKEEAPNRTATATIAALPISLFTQHLWILGTARAPRGIRVYQADCSRLTPPGKGCILLAVPTRCKARSGFCRFPESPLFTAMGSHI